MAQVFSVLGTLCAVCVVALSLGMHWYVKKRADVEPERAGRWCCAARSRARCCAWPLQHFSCCPAS